MIQYWLEEGLCLYYSLVQKDVFFWDVIGSVVCKGDDGKRFFYYEFVFRYFVKGKMGIFVFLMVMDD